MSDIKDTMLTWNIIPTKDMYRAKCAETGKEFYMASKAQLRAKVLDYESYIRDVVKTIQYIDQIRPKVEKYKDRLNGL